MYPTIATVAIGFVLLQAADAYWLDASCASVPNFQDSVANAFDFATTALALLKAQDPNVLNLFNILFLPGDTATVIGHLSGLGQVSGYSGVGNFASAAKGDVFIACDYSRFTEEVIQDGITYLYDPVGDESEEDGPTYQACKLGPAFGKTQFAYTSTLADYDGADTIQLCQWLLQYMAAQRWSDVKSLDPRWLVNPPQEAITTIAKYKGTPIDLYGLLEAAILHELTHTVAGGESDDVPGPLTNLVGTGGWGSTLVVRGTGGAKNAESLAMFGLGSKLVQLGFKVSFAGRLTPIATSKKERALSEGDEKVEQLVERFNMRMKDFVA